ncbi:unnamed protein product [Discosporangium mesarthrocarpum]
MKHHQVIIGLFLVLWSLPSQQGGTAAFILPSGHPKVSLTSTTASTRLAHQVHFSAAEVGRPREPLPGDRLLSLSLDELAGLLGGTGRAKMVWSALAEGRDPLDFEDGGCFLTEKTAEIVRMRFKDMPWRVVRESVSSCGTRKLLVQLDDGLEAETVIIPDLTGTRSTVCVSSQIGCARACQFCMTGKMGLVRNLSAGEILAQVYLARRTVRELQMPALTNVVFMGMGEPLSNPRAVQTALEQLTGHNTFGMAKKRISVSTVGPSPEAIRAMAAMPARLAWSVHAATDDIRRKLVPTTAHTMSELRQVEGVLLGGRGREHLFVEVALIRGVNDSEDMARALASLLRPLPTRASVNLLPLNDTGHPTFQASTPEAVLAFQRVLTEEGYIATIRRARGASESAACGQLATASQAEKGLQARGRAVEPG